MDDIIRRIYEYIRKDNLIEKEDNLVLAISGGADSIFMLYTLNEVNEKYNLGLNMVICHLNHMIRDEAISDLNYVKEVADKLNIEFFSKDVNIPNLSKEEILGEEELGRRERYIFFNEIGKEVFGENYKICTAHNLNDNTETVLLNLIRGTGIDGLTGINNITNNIIRPILFVERDLIEKYLNKRNIKYVIDKTNLESEYSRNSIRNELIPFIKEKYNENFDQSIYRMSQILRDENELLNKIITEIYNDENIILNKNSNRNVIEIDLKKFNELDIVIRRRLLRYILNEYFNIFTNISKINIDDSIEMAYKNIGNKYTMLNKEIKLSILDSKIIIEKLV